MTPHPHPHILCIAGSLSIEDTVELVAEHLRCRGQRVVRVDGSLSI
jgi:hypothetical protein